MKRGRPRKYHAQDGNTARIAAREYRKKQYLDKDMRLLNVWIPSRVKYALEDFCERYDLTLGQAVERLLTSRIHL